MDTTQEEFKKQLADRFSQLPKVVQEAITSADVEKHLRSLATEQKLHVDQWDLLENEVMLTLLGFQRPEDLEGNIQKEVGLTPETSRALAENINTIVFEPIRQELERHLEHPDAQAAQASSVDTARTQILGAAAEEKTGTPVPPATPPAPPPAQTVARAPQAPSSGAYKPGEPSTARASVVDDPYREPPQ